MLDKSKLKSLEERANPKMSTPNVKPLDIALYKLYTRLKLMKTLLVILFYYMLLVFGYLILLAYKEQILQLLPYKYI